MTDHEKCIVEHLAAAISERLWELRDSDATKALQLPNGQGDVSHAAFAAMMELRGDLWDDIKTASDLRVAEMLEQGTEPSDATRSLRRLAAEVIRRLVAKSARVVTNRRNNMLEWIPAEKAIYDAIQAVEGVGAHPLLTDAILLLNDAKQKVSEFVESQATDRNKT